MLIRDFGTLIFAPKFPAIHISARFINIPPTEIS